MVNDEYGKERTHLAYSKCPYKSANSFAKPHVNVNASNFDAAKCFSISNDVTFLNKIQCNGKIDLCCLRKSYYGGINFCCHMKEECAVWDKISSIFDCNSVQLCRIILEGKEFFSKKMLRRATN